MLECDENRHQSYLCAKEFLKLQQQSQDLNFRPIVLLRFNPSKYTDEDGIKHLWTDTVFY